MLGRSAGEPGGAKLQARARTWTTTSDPAALCCLAHREAGRETSPTSHRSFYRDRGSCLQTLGSASIHIRPRPIMRQAGMWMMPVLGLKRMRIRLEHQRSRRLPHETMVLRAPPRQSAPRCTARTLTLTHRGLPPHTHMHDRDGPTRRRADHHKQRLHPYHRQPSWSSAMMAACGQPSGCASPSSRTRRSST